MNQVESIPARPGVEPPSDEDIRRLARRIGRRFHPDKIILFGSRARGTVDPESDVDLLVVMRHTRSNHEQALEIRRSIEYDFPLDLLVRLPKEIERRVRLGDFFLREILNEGKVLYERPDSGKARPEGASRA